MRNLARTLAHAALSMLAALPAWAAASWTVNPQESRIAFSGTHAGRTFTGTFGKWSADIAFDPADLAGSKAIVRVDLTSAKTGDATYDKTLPTADWFDTAKSATATFTTTSFKAVGPKRYEADGTLELRGAKAPVVVAFDLDISGDVARVTGRTRLQRLTFDLGKKSDAGGEWVSLEIPVEIALSAKRKS